MSFFLHITFVNKNFKPRKEKNIMKNNNKNLNPLNDPEVEEMLALSPEDQLWYFLDDCIPHDGQMLSL